MTPSMVRSFIEIIKLIIQSIVLLCECEIAGMDTTKYFYVTNGLINKIGPML